MVRRPAQSVETPPDLPPEKAYEVLGKQLAKLQELKKTDYRTAERAEEEWFHLTERLVLRAFGSGSTNYSSFRRGRLAGLSALIVPGTAGMFPTQDQENFTARLEAYEAVLRSCIEELEIDLPEPDVMGVYQPGEEYEFYRDLSGCLKLAQKEIFVIDPYLNVEIFDVYAGAIPRTVFFRLLSNGIRGDVQMLAEKYAAGKNLKLRDSSSIHDRVLFADNHVWVCGQSLRDAAKKKPTYIVEHDEPLMRAAYEPIWQNASVII